MQEAVRQFEMSCCDNPTGSGLFDSPLFSCSVRNASGQTAADLAHAHGFVDCFRFISNAQKHLLQLGSLHVNGVQNGGAPCGLGRLNRKRLPTAVEPGHLKKARRAEGKTWAGFQ